ncbi:MAG: hypothetical protein ACR2G5_15420 [Pyrinomonadaceae bacterium]
MLTRVMLILPVGNLSGVALLIFQITIEYVCATRTDLLIVGPALSERNGLCETDGERFDALIKD